MAFRKVGNIRDGVPTNAGAISGAPRMGGLKKVGNIRTGITRAALPPTPRPDIRQSVNYKNAVSDNEKMREKAQKAASFGGMTTNFIKALPLGIRETAIGTPTKFAVSVGEVAEMGGNMLGGEAPKFSDRTYSGKLFGKQIINPFKSLQSDYGKVANDVVAGKKGLGSAIWSLAQVPIAGLSTGAMLGGLNRAFNAFSKASSLGSGIKSATPGVLDAFFVNPKTPKVSRKTQLKPQSLQEGVRGFTETLAADPSVPKSVYEDIPGYIKTTNKQTMKSAAETIDRNRQGVMNNLLNKGTQLTQDESAQAQLLIKQFIAEDNLAAAQQIARRTSTSATETAQSLQILSAYHKTTPEGAFRSTVKMIDDFNRKNPTRQIDLSPAKAKEIQALAGNVQKMKPGTREWDVAAALLEKSKSSIIPVSKLGKLSKIQTMAQLLNPKTAIRNIVGNTALDFMEDASRAVGAGIDKALYKMGFIKERNLVMPNLKTNWLNKMTGFKMGVSDAAMGIKTSGLSGKYDVISEAFKPGSIMNKLEKVLGFELGAFDKAFYNGRYMASLENIMEAKGASSPTPVMREIANAEALYATFQNNGKLAEALSKTKRALNFGKAWGLGDLLLKYPKTPGNIVQVGMDYSPIGFTKGLKQFYDSVKLLDPARQREAILNISRGITGSGLILGGAMMAKNGIITADPEKDPEMRAMKRESGQGPFSINFTALGRFFEGGDTQPKNGDTVVSYDWLQPNAIQLSMGANMVLNKTGNDKINDALETLSTGLDTVSEQPVFSGVKRFISNLDTSRGGGIGKAVTEAIAGAPSSLTPSILNQLGQLTDNTSRETYDPRMIQSSLNKVLARIPGARETLQPRIGTLGNELEGYKGGTNTLTNVFLNPAFINKYKVSPVAQEVIDIYNRTGETKQTPRIAPKKIKIDGESYTLSPQQYNQYQRFIGQKTEQEFSKLIQDPYFNSLTDEQKANEMSTLLTNITKEGRDDLAQTGGLAPSIEMQAKSFLRAGDMDGFVNFIKKNPQLNTKADYMRMMNELKAEGFSQEDKDIMRERSKRTKQKANQPFFIP